MIMMTERGWRPLKSISHFLGLISYYITCYWCFASCVLCVRIIWCQMSDHLKDINTRINYDTYNNCSFSNSGGIVLIVMAHISLSRTYCDYDLEDCPSKSQRPFTRGKKVNRHNALNWHYPLIQSHNCNCPAECDSLHLTSCWREWRQYVTKGYLCQWLADTKRDKNNPWQRESDVTEGCQERWMRHWHFGDS